MYEIQDASFSAWTIWWYFLGATSSIHVIARENHAAGLGMMPMTEVTASIRGRSAKL